MYVVRILLWRVCSLRSLWHGPRIHVWFGSVRYICFICLFIHMLPQPPDIINHMSLYLLYSRNCKKVFKGGWLKNYFRETAYGLQEEENKGKYLWDRMWTVALCSSVGFQNIDGTTKVLEGKDKMDTTTLYQKSVSNFLSILNYQQVCDCRGGQRKVFRILDWKKEWKLVLAFRWETPNFRIVEK